MKNATHSGMTTIMNNSEGKDSPDMKHFHSLYHSHLTKDQKNGAIIHLLLEKNVTQGWFTANVKKDSSYCMATETHLLLQPDCIFCLAVISFLL